MLRLKRITSVIILVLSAIIIISNNLLGNPTLIKPVVSLSGKVINKSDNSPLGTKIFIYNEKNKKIGVFKSNDTDGTYFLTGLKPSTVYYLIIETTRNSYKKVKLLTPQVDEYTEIIRDLIIDNEKNKIEMLTKK